MTFHDLSFEELVSCPITGGKPRRLEPWLYAPEDGDELYPIIGKTPVLQPNTDLFMVSQQDAVYRLIAEDDVDPEFKRWFLSRYGGTLAGDQLPFDTEVVGESYPGFWELIDAPAFVRDLQFESARSFILDTIGDHHPQIGLDIGCGQGGMLQHMAQNCRQLVGLESNLYLAALANRLLRQKTVDIRYFDPTRGFRDARLEKEAVENAVVICGDAAALPFSEPLFDWVHCGHILDLVEDPADLLVAVMRILKPGGWLSISTPWDFRDPGHFDAMLEILDLDFQEINRKDGLPWVRLNHRRRYLLHEDWAWVGRLK